MSHELKTPLTSIRMYGEMLKAGWADDAKKQTYYDYIHSESERLSRLIENVLQLARLTRNSQQLELKRVAGAELIDMVRSKCATQVERAGFALDGPRRRARRHGARVVDADAFAQIVINLVDNALKFSARRRSEADRDREPAETRRRRSCSRCATTAPAFRRGRRKRIFELFYRPENELTRETVGTGIGLALVHAARAPRWRRASTCRNCEPGAEFRVSFPTA